MGTPRRFSPGMTLFCTTFWLSSSPSTAIFLPFRVCWLFIRLIRTESVRSGVVPGRMMRPGGDWLMIAWVRSKVSSTVLVVLGDTGLGIAGEVDEVAHHGEDVGVLGELGAQGQGLGVLDRAVALVVGHDAPARDPTVGVDVLDEGVVDLALVGADHG